MSKVTRILLAIGLILAVATPALAEFKLNGYYRLMAHGGEVRSGGSLDESGGFDGNNAKDEKGDSRQMVDQRLRMQLTYSLNDNVSIVYFGEVDTVWGERDKNNYYDSANAGADGYSASGGGGRLGADGVNVETKNVYLDLKAGDMAARLGIQTLADAYQGVVFFDDMAAANLTYKLGATTLNGFYSKWDEDDNRSDWDDRDFWGANVSHKFSDNFTAGASVYFEDDNDSATASLDEQAIERFFYGLNADARFGSFGVNGFVVYADSEVDNKTGDDVDGEALAATIKGSMKLDSGDVGLRVIYISEDDDAKDNNAWRTPVGRYDFVNENLMQFLTDKFVLNYGKERYAMNDAAEEGFGLLGFVLSGNHKLPSDMYLNWGAGYFLAIDDERNDPTAAKPAKGSQITSSSDYRRGDTLGYEVSARVGKKFFEKVDVSLNASYADYGDFYDDTVLTAAGKVEDPDATYKAYLMVNVPF